MRGEPLTSSDAVFADASSSAGQSYATPRSLIDLIIDSPVGTSSAASVLDRFLAEPSGAKALTYYLGAAAHQPLEDVLHRLACDIATIDSIVSRQVNAIIHNPQFQRLEASWRGLTYLVNQLEGKDAHIKIRVFSAGWKELARDFERAIEFDQSQLFKKVYSDEFDTPGGEPFSVLLADYEVHPLPSADHPVDDLAVLAGLSQVAAAAFAPLIAGVHPSMFGVDNFSELERTHNLARTFDQIEYLKWRALREREDARFVGLTAPRVLARLPYDDDGSRVDRFSFREDVAGPDHNKYLWGTAVYAFGSVLLRAFDEAGWLADIRGVQRGIEGGGLVTGLPVHQFGTDASGVAQKCSTDVIITDPLEKQLCDLGFIGLSHCKDTEFSAFYSNSSFQKPKKYDEIAATMNAKISAMLQYMLCISRFAHYIKVLIRSKVGSFTEAEELENILHRWIVQYVTADSEASSETKAAYPLREARIQVREHPGKPGSYLCVAHLWPHFELDELNASVKIATELSVKEAK